MRTLALDVGENRIGVALSDPTGTLASPLTTIHRRDDASAVDEVLRLTAEHEVAEIVVGLPLSLSGREGPQAARARSFADLVAERSSIPVKFVDERLSSVQAERLLRESGVEPSRDRARVDAAAAAVVLQTHLDSKRAEPR